MLSECAQIRNQVSSQQVEDDRRIALGARLGHRDARYDHEGALCSAVLGSSARSSAHGTAGLLLILAANATQLEGGLSPSRSVHYTTLAVIKVAV